MKNILITTLLIFSIIEVKAQDFSVQINTGLSHFTGDATSSSTFLNAYTDNHSGYPNAIGNRYVPTYGIDLQLQKVFNGGFIFGTRFGFESINSRVDITSVKSGGNEIAASGHADSHLYYFNFNPYIGVRANLNKINLDVTSGIEIAPGLATRKYVDVKTIDGDYFNKPYNFSNFSPREDFRFRLGAEAVYDKFGVTVSYSRGIKNFNSETFPNSKLLPFYSELFRLGISYRIK